MNDANYKLLCYAPWIIQAKLPQHLSNCVRPKPGTDRLPVSFFSLNFIFPRRDVGGLCPEPVDTFSHEGYLVYGVLC